MKSLFAVGQQHSYRFLVAMMAASMLVFLDLRFTQIDQLRQTLSYLVSPVQSLVSLPRDLLRWSGQTFAERDELLEANRALRSQVGVLQTKIQQLAILEVENDRLRRLLDATARLSSNYLTAELISVDPDPFSIQVIVNRGAQDGIYVGQAVVDADGLFGLVVQVDSLTSRVALIADVNMAVPVYVNRNGMRSVVIGAGDLMSLEMEFVPDTADLLVGDMLVSSGLAERFPAGYPVAEVVSIERDPGEPFAQIRARPFAQLDRSRNLLMVFGEESE